MQVLAHFGAGRGADHDAVALEGQVGRLPVSLVAHELKAQDLT